MRAVSYSPSSARLAGKAWSGPGNCGSDPDATIAFIGVAAREMQMG